MKHTLRFLLSISNTKMVVLNSEGKQNYFVGYKESPLGIRHNLNKLANCIAEYD